MTREEVAAWAERHGYSKDRWGKYQKEILTAAAGSPSRKTRLVISNVACRLEVQVTHTPGGSVDRSWVRLRSGYLKNLSVTADDKLIGLTTKGCGVS